MNSHPFSIEPMGAGAILDRSFKTYRNNFVQILLFGVLIGGLPDILSFLIALITGRFAAGTISWSEIFDYIQRGARSPLYYLEILQAYAVGRNAVIAIIGALILTPLSMAGIAAVSTGYFRGERRTAWEWFLEVTNRLKDIFVTNLCLYIAGIAVAILAVIAVVIMGVIVGFLAAVPVVGFVLLAVYVILIFTVAVAIGTVAWMTYAVLMNENKKNFAAISRAASLVFSKFWKTVGISLLAAFIIGIIGSVIGAVLGALGILGGFGTALSSLLNTAVNLILEPVVSIVTALLYISIRIEKEGYDLELRADVIGGQSETGNYQSGFDPWEK